MADEFSKRDSFHLAVTPEGTRSLAPKWKMGFYHIAVTANVPIQLAYLDYKKKEVAIKEIFHPTGDEIADLEKIQSYYKNVNACISACSSMVLETGFPAPCPVFTSILINTGFAPACFSCNSAPNLNECAGTTRSS